MNSLKMAKGQNVVLYDGDLLRRRNENRNYLLELEAGNLLLPYTLEAVLYVDKYSERVPKQIHGGWESPACELRGHFLGHYLSAAAMHFEATGDTQLKAKGDEIVQVLAQCQQANGGQWAASIPEKYLNRMERKMRVWGPQYTIHKTFMGLLDMYTIAGNEQALNVAINFGEWFYTWSGRFSKEEFQEILDYETGGMLEIWAILYQITKKDMFKVLMERYYRCSLFDGLLEGKDVVTNMHANTTIPEILGAAKCYEVTGEQKFFDIVDAYWKAVVDEKGCYVTGGQTCGEVWSPDQDMSARLGEKNQEHCTVYNMMRLADFLFRYKKDSRYMDYWEKNLYNGIMAQGYWREYFSKARISNNPQEGLLLYYLPLWAGAQKPWSTKTQDFFCCHGTLVQANAAHNNGIYYTGEKQVYICQYFNSDFIGEVDGKTVSIMQRIDRLSGPTPQKINSNAATYLRNPNKMLCNFMVKCESKSEFEILIRIPEWLSGSAKLTVNGEPVAAKLIPGSFATIKRVWNNDVICLELSKKIIAHKLPGVENMVAFTDGPIVLAGLCDDERTLYVDGDPASVLVPECEREWVAWTSIYKTTGQASNIRFIPLYQVGYEKYTVYFPIEGKAK